MPHLRFDLQQERSRAVCTIQERKLPSEATSPFSKGHESFLGALSAFCRSRYGRRIRGVKVRTNWRSSCQRYQLQMSPRSMIQAIVLYLESNAQGVIMLSWRTTTVVLLNYYQALLVLNHMATQKISTQRISITCVSCVALSISYRCTLFVESYSYMQGQGGSNRGLCSFFFRELRTKLWSLRRRDRSFVILSLAYAFFSR